MRRLDRARALIRDGVPLADAALACGFADQSHMTRQFKTGLRRFAGPVRGVGGVKRRYLQEFWTVEGRSEVNERHALDVN